MIPMRSKGAIDSSTIMTINTEKTSAVLSADSIGSLNKVKRPGAEDALPSRAPSAQRQSIPAQRQSTPVQRQSPPAVAAAIPHKPLPGFSAPIQKGQKVLLSPSPVSKVKACLGWNVSNASCDLDVSAFLLSKEGKVIGDDWFVFYGQQASPDKSVVFSQVHDQSDREMIQVDFVKLHPSVNKIVFVLTINEALEKHLNFSMVKDAYIRIMDPSNHGRELVSYQMTDYYSNVISMMIGELYLHNGTWKFNAVGNGVAKDLAGLCGLYGVQVV